MKPTIKSLQAEINRVQKQLEQVFLSSRERFERQHREYEAALAEARRRTIPYLPNNGRCFGGGGKMVNFLPSKVVSINIPQRYSSSPAEITVTIEVSGNIIESIEGRQVDSRSMQLVSTPANKISPARIARIK